MPCEHVKIGDGHAIICSAAPRRKRCSVKGCGEWASKECDYRIDAKTKTGTCDKPLCEIHAVHVKGKDLDYCPDHPEVVAALRRRA